MRARKETADAVKFMLHLEFAGTRIDLEFCGAPILRRACIGFT